MSDEEYTEIGKLYARLVHTGKRQWPQDVPDLYHLETYAAYTEYYQYEPALEPVPNEQSELPVE